MEYILPETLPGKIRTRIFELINLCRGGLSTALVKGFNIRKNI